MSGQTIRDVLIKVSVENGQMKLAPPDMSAWRDEIAKIRAELSSLAASGSSGSIGVGSASTAASIGMNNNQSAVKYPHVLSIDGGATQKLIDAAKDRLAVIKQEVAAEAEMTQVSNKSAQQSVQSAQVVAQLSRGIGHLAASTGTLSPELAKTVVAIEGLYNIGSSASTLFGGPWAAAITAAVGGLMVFREMAISSREAIKAMLEDTSTSAGRMSGLAHTQLMHQSSGMMRMASQMPDRDQWHRVTRHMQTDKTTEDNIRLFQGEVGENDFSERGRIRERMERQSGLEKQERDVRYRIGHLDEQIGANADAKSTFEENKKKSQQAYEAKLRSIESRRVVETPDAVHERTQTSRSLQSGVHAGLMAVSGSIHPALGAYMLMGGGERTADAIVDAAGGTSKRQAGIENAGLQAEKADAEAERQKQINEENQKGIEIEQQSARWQAQKVQALGEQVKLTKEMVDASRQAAEQDKQRVTAAAENIGMRSAGQRLQMREVAKKVARIKSQMAQKAAGKDVTVDELNQHELGVAASFGKDTDVGRFAGDFAINRAKEEGGYGIDFDKANKSQEVAEKYQRQHDEQIKTNSPQIEKGQDKLDATADKIVSGLRDAVDFQAFADKLEVLAQEWKQWFENFKMAQHGTFSR